MGSDPSSNLLDGGLLELPVSRAILEGRVPSGRKKRGGLEVAGSGGEKRRLGETDYLAEAELGVVKLTTDKVGAGVGGMGAIEREVGDNGVGGRVLKGEERIREEMQGVGDVSGACLGDEDVMATIVGEIGGEPENVDTMMGP
jgi:hypothetical protein